MTPRRARNPEQTRAALLDAAFREILAHGYHGASLERILANTGVTKGALYHHFPHKQALGLAVVREVIGRAFDETLVAPLAGVTDPLPVLREVLGRRLVDCSPETLALGCPLNNLIQELSPRDEAFRHALNEVVERWRAAIEAALRHGQRAGTVRPDADPAGAAHFLIAAVEGIHGMGKALRNPEALRACLGQLEAYLACLAP